MQHKKPLALNLFLTTQSVYQSSHCWTCLPYGNVWWTLACLSHHQMFWLKIKVFISNTGNAFKRQRRSCIKCWLLSHSTWLSFIWRWFAGFLPSKREFRGFKVTSITYEPWRKMRNCIKVSNLMQKLQLQNRCFKNTFDRILLRVHFLNFNTFVHFKLTVYLRNSTMLCLFLWMKPTVLVWSVSRFEVSGKYDDCVVISVIRAN